MVLGIPKKALVVVAVLAGVLLIYLMGSDQRSSEGSQQGGGASGSSGCRMSVTADILNVRAGPTIDARIVGQFEHGAQTDAQNVVRGGFRKLGENRWAAGEFLRPVDGAHCG